MAASSWVAIALAQRRRHSRGFVIPVDLALFHKFDNRGWERERGPISVESADPPKECK